MIGFGSGRTTNQEKLKRSMAIYNLLIHSKNWSKAIAGTQTKTFVKENLFTRVHVQIICHRKFARVDGA